MNRKPKSQSIPKEKTRKQWFFKFFFCLHHLTVNPVDVRETRGIVLLEATGSEAMQALTTLCPLLWLQAAWRTKGSCSDSCPTSTTGWRKNRGYWNPFTCPCSLTWHQMLELKIIIIISGLHHFHQKLSRLFIKPPYNEDFLGFVLHLCPLNIESVTLLSTE